MDKFSITQLHLISYKTAIIDQSVRRRRWRRRWRRRRKSGNLYSLASGQGQAEEQGSFSPRRDRSFFIQSHMERVARGKDLNTHLTQTGTKRTTPTSKKLLQQSSLHTGPLVGQYSNNSWHWHTHKVWGKEPINPTFHETIGTLGSQNREQKRRFMKFNA